MNSRELRKLFIEFFTQREHRSVPSSPLIPPDDPTMLFTSAGMVQFKPLWSGKVELPYRRAVTVQKCFRAGGKSSDLENVGRTLRHLTFFEMLGNFSFGDYFKGEAIHWAWEFTTELLKLPAERLYASVFEEDDDAYQIWQREIGLPEHKIVRLGAAENFWGPAGDTGACGPCSELHMDMGEQYSCGKPSCTVGCDCERYLEFWNLVFPQFDQQRDGSRPPLKNRGIDTGLGLERLACIVQQKASLFETDVLFPIVHAAGSLLNVDYPSDHDTKTALHVIADHIRGLTFVLSEGVIPSNEGRGYVLRRILRRALRHGKKMGSDQPFLFQLVDTVIETLGDVYPEIKSHPAEVKKTIKLEEERFLRTLSQGIELLDEIISRMQTQGQRIIPGEDVFRLYDTYGFPADITFEIAEEHGFTIDEAGFQQALNHQRQLAKASWKGSEAGHEDELLKDIFETYGPTRFVGYDSFNCEANLLAIIHNQKRVEELKEGETGILILDETPFCAEAGGQVDDTGVIELYGVTFQVERTLSTASDIFLHHGRLTQGTLRVGEIVNAQVEQRRRLAIMRNHTATHLLQGALKRIVGKHITQSGSLVTPDYLRFDFTHLEALSPEQIRQVEAMVQECIRDDLSVEKLVLPREEAQKLGAIAPFGEKYGTTVRVLKIADFSLEFCGGTHLDRTGKIGLFLIKSESSIAAGVRRIEALTGEGAFACIEHQRDLLKQLSHTLSVAEDRLPERVQALQDELRRLRKEAGKFRQTKAVDDVDQLLQDAKDVKGITVITGSFQQLEYPELRHLADIVRQKAPHSVVVLGSVKNEKVMLLCAVTEDLTQQLPANKVIKDVAAQVGGSGGGKPDLAQAGGKHPEKLDHALQSVEKIVASLL